ncbi:MAG: MFS transporter [Lachnospirales bacterium]
MYTKKNVYHFMISQSFTIIGIRFIDMAISIFFLKTFVGTGNLGFFNAICMLTALFLHFPFVKLNLKLNRKRQLVYSNFLLAVGSSIIAFFVFTEYGSENIFLYATLTLVLCNVCSAHHRISSDLMLFDLTDDIDVEKKYFTYSAIMITIAPILGVVVYSLFGISIVIFVMAIMFNIAATATVFLKYDESKAKPLSSGGKIKLINVTKYIDVKADPVVKRVIKVICLLNFFVTPILITGLPSAAFYLGMETLTLGLSAGVLVIGTTFLMYSNFYVKRKRIAFHLLLNITFATLGVVSIIIPLCYYSILNAFIFEIIMYFAFSIIAVSFSLLNAYSYIVLNSKIKTNVHHDFYALLTLTVLLCVFLGNIVLGILLKYSLVGNALFLFSFFAMCFLQDIGYVSVSKE